MNAAKATLVQIDAARRIIRASPVWHFPGYRLAGTCPACGYPEEYSLDNFACQPQQVGKPFPFDMICSNCGCIFIVNLLLKLSLELAEESNDQQG